MANLRISDLTALAEAPASLDEFEMVDVSDTTDSAEGSSKKVTKSYLLSGYATSGANSNITSLSGITTPLSVAQGGTASTTASDARTALGLAIGTNVQAYDATLGTVAGGLADTKVWVGGAGGEPAAQTVSGDATLANTGALTIANAAVSYAKIQNVSASDKLLGRVSTGAGSVEEVACTDFAQSILDDVDEATFKATVNLEIGTDVQAYNATLAAVAGATYAGDDSIVTVGTLSAGNADAVVSASSVTVAGKVELATTAEINTGTDSTRAIPVDQFVASNRNVRYIMYRVLDATTDTAADSGTAIGGDLECPITGTITEVGAYNDTAGTTGTATYDIHLSGTTIMASTKISIETTEKSSRDATTQPVLTTTAITAGNILTFFCDAINTTAAKGLTFRVGIRLA